MPKPRLILASASPRRRELLQLLGIPFEVVPADVNETPLPDESDVDFVTRAAREKGLEVAATASDAIVLAADTIVSVDGDILGKPRDRDEAVRMLKRLSGRRHSVYTAVFTVDSSVGAQHAGLDQTRVWFHNLDNGTIDEYIDREEVFDKAGAYGIQGFASVFVPKIEGNYPNVMGLPLPLTRELLTRHGLLSWSAG